MKALNKETAAKTQRPERIIQFGEGNFLRAFVDWIIYNMNEKTDFNSSVVVVQPIEKGMVDMLNAQAKSTFLINPANDEIHRKVHENVRSVTDTAYGHNPYYTPIY